MSLTLRDTHHFDTPLDRLWPLIFDPAVLVGLIPGCDDLQEVAPGEYRGEMRLGIAAVAGTYQTQVKVVEMREPTFCHMQGEVSGPTGTITGKAALELCAADGGGTDLAYEGKATITGALATMSPRFVEGVARALIRQGLRRLAVQAQAEAPAGTAE